MTRACLASRRKIPRRRTGVSRGETEGAFGGILQFFAEEGVKWRKPCHSNSKWRKPLEDAGVKFDKDDFVTDWQHTKNPL